MQHTVLMSVEAARRCVWVCRAGAGATAGAGGGAGATAGAGAGAGASDPAESADAAHSHELQRRLANLQRDLKVRF